MHNTTSETRPNGPEITAGNRRNAMHRIFGAVALLFALSAATAQEATRLDVTTVVQKEETFVNESGDQETRLVPAESVVPGERVVYTITFRNLGDEPADNVVVTNPIDRNLTYVDGSAFAPGTRLEFSVDGGTTFGPAGELTVVENGSRRAATPDDFTHVRWVMNTDLAAGAQAMARFAAVLD